MPNLVRFCNKDLGMNIGENNSICVGPVELVHPFVHTLTGHGNIVLSSSEASGILENILVQEASFTSVTTTGWISI